MVHRSEKRLGWPDRRYVDLGIEQPSQRFVGVLNPYFLVLSDERESPWGNLHRTSRERLDAEELEPVEDRMAAGILG